MPVIILGLGSNLGDRMAHLRAAADGLRALTGGMRSSRIFESKAVLPAGAPADWDISFLNMAVCEQTDITPQALLAEIKSIEKNLGRVERGVWAPREIDIDILACGEEVVNTLGLRIPHPHLLDRDFALLPLAELVPDWRYPGTGEYNGWKAADIVAAKKFTLNEHLQDTGVRLDAA